MNTSFRSYGPRICRDVIEKIVENNLIYCILNTCVNVCYCHFSVNGFHHTDNSIEKIQWFHSNITSFMNSVFILSVAKGLFTQCEFF